MTLRHRFTLIAQRPMNIQSELTLQAQLGQDHHTWFASNQSNTWHLASIQHDEWHFECLCFGTPSLSHDYRFMMETIETHLTHTLSWKRVHKGWQGDHHQSNYYYPYHPMLFEALHKMYEQFSHISVPSQLNFSSLSPLPKETISALSSIPLHSIPAQHISRYAFKAMTTCGTAEDFRYYFPRILEIIMIGDFEYHEDLIISKLIQAQFTTWPIEDQMCVYRLFEQWIIDVIYHSAYPSLWDRVMLAHGIGVHVSPLLSKIKLPIFRILEFVDELISESSIQIKTLQGSHFFWQTQSPQAQAQLISWLCDHILTELESIALSHLESASKASQLYDYLEHFITQLRAC